MDRLCDSGKIEEQAHFLIHCHKLNCIRQKNCSPIALPYQITLLMHVLIRPQQMHIPFMCQCKYINFLNSSNASLKTITFVQELLQSLIALALCYALSLPSIQITLVLQTVSDQ